MLCPPSLFASCSHRGKSILLERESTCLQSNYRCFWICEDCHAAKDILELKYISAKWDSEEFAGGFLQEKSQLWFLDTEWLWNVLILKGYIQRIVMKPGFSLPCATKEIKTSAVNWEIALFLSEIGFMLMIPRPWIALSPSLWNLYTQRSTRSTKIMGRDESERWELHAYEGENWLFDIVLRMGRGAGESSVVQWFHQLLCTKRKRERKQATTWTTTSHFKP